MQPIEDASSLLLCFVWRLQSCFCRSRDGPDSAQASTSDGVSDSRHDSEATYRDQLNCSSSAQALHDARQQLQTAGDSLSACHHAAIAQSLTPKCAVSYMLLSFHTVTCPNDSTCTPVLHML